MVMLYNSCRMFYNKLTKLGLQFYEFSTIFYGFSNIQPNTLYYLRNYLHRGP
jgi:hypothetical protein